MGTEGDGPSPALFPACRCFHSLYHLAFPTPQWSVCPTLPSQPPGAHHLLSVALGFLLILKCLNPLFPDTRPFERWTGGHEKSSRETVQNGLLVVFFEVYTNISADHYEKILQSWREKSDELFVSQELGHLYLS